MQSGVIETYTVTRTRKQLWLTGLGAFMKGTSLMPDPRPAAEGEGHEVLAGTAPCKLPPRVWGT